MIVGLGFGILAKLNLNRPKSMIDCSQSLVEIYSLGTMQISFSCKPLKLKHRIFCLNRVRG